MKFIEFITKGFSLRGEKVVKIQKIKTSGNRSFLIQTDKAKYVFRISGDYLRSRTKKEICSEIFLLEFLARNNIPVPITIKLNDKRIFVTNYGVGLCYKVLEGTTIQNADTKDCFEIGRLLGQIHNLTEGMKFPYERKSWGVGKTKEKFFEVEKEIYGNDILNKHNFAKRYYQELNKLNFPSLLRKGIVHEDLGVRHVLFSEGKISGVLDWDRSYEGFLILDLGQIIRGWALNESGRVDKNKMKAILNGYKNKRKLTLSERIYLKRSIKFAFLERALSFSINVLNKNQQIDADTALQELEIAETI